MNDIPKFVKWAGGKGQLIEQFKSLFPKKIERYIEPFVGTGAVLAALNPHKGIAGDMLKPLIEIMTLLQESPDTLIQSYADNWNQSCYPCSK